jgi:Fe-Mn family superoxide dismutase
MEFEAPPLPYSRRALAPTISEDTLKEHYDKHFLGYVEKLNAITQVVQAPDETSLEHFIFKGAKASWKKTPGGVLPPVPDATHLFDMAAQVYNHVFFWNSLKHKGGGEPDGEVAKGVAAYGGLEKLRADVVEAGAAVFGSGWVWICAEDGKLVLLRGLGAALPIVYEGYVPLLTIDVWEHAYYLDYKSDRKKYIGEVFDNLLNWDFANENLENA